jgi:hypothetical protein
VAVSIQLLNPNATHSGTRSSANLGASVPNNTHNHSNNNMGNTISTHSASSINLLAGNNGPTGTAANTGADLPPRVLVLTQQGGMLILDIEGFQLRSVGFYTVKVSGNESFLISLWRF